MNYSQSTTKKHLFYIDKQCAFRVWESALTEQFECVLYFALVA